MTKYALPAFVATLLVALFLALVAAPYLADWIATRATETYGYGYGYDYGYRDGPFADGYAQETRWPVGSVWLILAFLGFAAIGAGVMAMAWSMHESYKPILPDPKAKRRKKIEPVVEAVNRRSDLSSGEKQEFKDSAFALADADDAPSVKAAELIGKDDAVIAAKGLAGEAENDFLKALRHAVNIALPFSDKTAKTIEKRHDHFAKLDEMVAELEACRKPKTGCGCGPAAAPACTCGKDDCAHCACDPCKGGRKGNHARLDVVWD